MRKVGVYLGRFSPYHIKHEEITRKMIEDFGIENCLIMVGSATSYNYRTPFTFEQRKKMILTIFPDLDVLPLPDTKPSLVHFDGSTNDVWLDSIEKIEKEMGCRFVFYGGSDRDLEVLATRFETVIAYDRDKKECRLSATDVREALDHGDAEVLNKMLNPLILEYIKSAYKQFLETRESRERG